MMKPSPNAAPTIPKFWARFSGGVISARYAYAGMNDAPAMPESVRPTKSHVMLARGP
jgi:hypothetical protein